MSTTQPSADPPKSRLRGDMYLRAEQRHREEMAAAAHGTAARTSATAPTYRPPSDSRVSDAHAIETADRLSPVSAATEVVVMAPVSVAGAVVAARPAVGLTAPEAGEPSVSTPPLVMSRRPQTEAQPGTRLAAPRSTGPTVRRQRTLVPAAALGAIAIVATLGAALTLSPGDGPEEATAAATSPAAPRPAVETPPAAAPAATARPVVNPATPAAPVPAGTARSATAPPRPQAAVARAARPAVAAGAAAARALDGQIRITSTPPGARVTIDGIGRGQTPVTVGQLSFGERRIRVTQDGYASHETAVRISGDNPVRTVSVALRRR